MGINTWPLTKGHIVCHPCVKTPIGGAFCIESNWNFGVARCNLFIPTIDFVIRFRTVKRYVFFLNPRPSGCPRPAALSPRFPSRIVVARGEWSLVRPRYQSRCRENTGQSSANSPKYKTLPPRKSKKYSRAAFGLRPSRKPLLVSEESEREFCCAANGN